MKRDKKGSLTRELAVILVGLVAGTIMLCLFINTSFLEKYYMLNKQDSLIDGYDVINGASETGELNSSEFDVTFDNLCANGNIAVMIISSNRAIVRSSVNDNQVILMEFMNILFGDDRNQTEILQRSDNYVIQKQTDTRLSSEYMVLYGTLSNGNLILMRTAVESIREMPMRGRRKEIKMSPMKMDRIMTKVGSNTEINFAICLSVSSSYSSEIWCMTSSMEPVRKPIVIMEV